MQEATIPLIILVVWMGAILWRVVHDDRLRGGRGGSGRGRE